MNVFGTKSFGPLCATLALIGAVLCVPAAAATAAPAPFGNQHAQTGGDDFLPPDMAFRFDALPDGPDRVKLNWEIADGYYLYRARVKVATTSTQAQLGALQLPTGQTKQDEYFGKQEVYHHELVASLPVAHAANATLQLPLQVTYQGCADAGLCYPPITKTVSITLSSGTAAAGADSSGAAAGQPGRASASAPNPASATASVAAVATANNGAGFVSEQDWFASIARSGSIFALLGWFYLGGLGVAFTGCVLPMIPILSGMIVGAGKDVTKGRAFALSVAYVLGMSVTYTIAGAVCAAAGQQVQALFQQAWILILFAAVFVALALSMFGAFTLQMPAAVQTFASSLSNRQSAGTYGGVAVMGALSSLIVTACVGPVLVGALLVISQTGQILRGAAALFALSIGMGTPLLIVGASAGALLPKVGPWMDTVKRLMGVMMLAVAAWMLARIVPPRFTLMLWAVPAVAAAVVLVTATRSRSVSAWTVRAAGVAAALYAVALMVGFTIGGTDALAPIPALAGAHHELEFRTIKSVADLEREVVQAKTSGRTVLLDFYADWCTSCKEMERYTFTDASVQSTLGKTVLLRADVTRNDADDQALLKHFGIFGPPTIAFYGSDGQERANYRVVGYMKAEAFAARAREAFQAHTQLSEGPDVARRDPATGS